MDILAIDQDNADAWSLLASMHAARGELRAARKTYEHILTKTEATESTAPNSAGSIGGKRDLYALVALGNLHHRLAKQHNAKPAVRRAAWLKCPWGLLRLRRAVRPTP